MLFSTKMLYDDILWSVYGNITDSTFIIPNFSHNQKFLLHDIINIFRHNIGTQPYFNIRISDDVVVILHPENLVNQVHYYEI